MHRSFAASGAVLVAAISLGLSGCGSSNTTTSGAAATPTPTAPPTAAGGANSGSVFCVQAAAAVAQLSHISSSFVSTTPGATPSLTSIQQLFATADSAIDTLDSSAPSEISSAFHTLRSAYDQANSQAQSATTLEGLSASVSGLSAAPVSAADTQITNYLQTSCGIATPSP